MSITMHKSQNNSFSALYPWGKSANVFPGQNVGTSGTTCLCVMGNEWIQRAELYVTGCVCVHLCVQGHHLHLHLGHLADAFVQSN